MKGKPTSSGPRRFTPGARVICTYGKRAGRTGTVMGEYTQSKEIRLVIAWDGDDTNDVALEDILSPLPGVT